METILYLTTLAALIGAYLNAKGKWYSFAIWMVTNAVFAGHNLNIQEYQQAGLFLSYMAISVYGLDQCKTDLHQKD